MKNLGYELIYPPGCKELDGNLKVDELRKRLNDLSLSLDKIIDIESCNGDSFNDNEDSVTTSQHNNLKGLFLLLLSNHFVEHADRDVQLRVAVCICKMLKIFCPSNPFAGMTDENLLTKNCLNFILHCVQLLSTIKSKSDVHYPKLHTILYICCQIDIFLWCATVEDESILFTCLKTTFSIIRNLSVWAWTEISIIRQMLLDMVVKVVIQSENLLTSDMLTFLMELLIEPAKSTQPEQHTFARDLILRTARYLEYPVQMLLQNVLIAGSSEKAVDISSSLRRNGTSSPHDDGSNVDEGENVKNPLAEHCFLIIYALHTIQNSLVDPVLPSIELKLKSVDSRDRKRSLRLLARLFSEPNSSLHNKFPSLWAAFLGRFNDIDEEVRKLCVHMVPQLLKQNPDLPREAVLHCIRQRAHDPSEEVRLFVLRTVSAMITDMPDEITGDLYELLKERSRDKSLAIRKEAAGTLASVYRHLSKAEHPLNETMALVVNTILHMYYHPSHDDRIVVERLFKSTLVPYSLGTLDRVRALFTCYALMDEASVRAMQEMFKVQFTAMNLVRDALQFLSNQDGKKLPSDVQVDLMDRLQLLAALLPKSDKSVEHVKKFFNQVLSDKCLRSQLTKLTKPSCSCTQAANIMRDILKRLDSGGGTGSTADANTNYIRSVKIILERSAPVLFDKEFGQELVTQLVVIRETGCTFGISGGGPSAMTRSLRLLHSLAVYFKKVLPTDEILDYLVGILSEESEPNPSTPENMKPTDLFNSDPDPPTTQELALGVLCCMLGGSSMSQDRDPSTRAGSKILDSQFYGSLSNLEQRASKFLPLLKRFCCTGMTGDCSTSFDKPTTTTGANRARGKGKRANVPTGVDAASSTLVSSAYLSGLTYRRERRRAKLATRCLLCLLKVSQRSRSHDDSPNRRQTDDDEVEPGVDLDEADAGRSAPLGISANVTQFESKIQQVLDEVVETCLSCSIDSLDYVTCLTSLGRIALLLPGVYNKEFKKYMIKSLIQEVLVHESDPSWKSLSESAESTEVQSILSRHWLPDGYLPQATRIKISALKLMTNWLRGLKNEVKPVAQAVIRLLHRIIIHDGDLTREGKLLPGEMSRLRLVAAVSWIKLAHSQSYVESIEVDWYQSMTYIICDPCAEVRAHFLTKLNQGLIRLRLPLDYMAMFAHAADVPDLAFKQRAKQLLTANVQRRRDFLSRHPDYMKDPKYLFGILPDFVLPYLIYLLAHDPEWSELNDANRLNRIKTALWFVLDPIVTRGHNFIFLRKIIEKIKHTRDALAPDNVISNAKLYIVCDIALGLLLTRSSDLTIKEYPVDVKLPKALYQAAPAGFKNPDFAQLLEPIDGTLGPNKPTRPLIQFTPAKSARALKEGLMPAELLKEKRPAQKTPPESQSTSAPSESPPETQTPSVSTVPPTISSQRNRQTKLVPITIDTDESSSDQKENHTESATVPKSPTKSRKRQHSVDNTPPSKRPNNVRKVVKNLRSAGKSPGIQTTLKSTSSRSVKSPQKRHKRVLASRQTKNIDPCKARRNPMRK